MAQTAAAAKPPVIRWHFAPSAFAALRRVDSRLRGNDEGSGNDEGIDGSKELAGMTGLVLHPSTNGQIELFSALDNEKAEELPIKKARQAALSPLTLASRVRLPYNR